jgi:hypothetical protein
MPDESSPGSSPPGAGPGPGRTAPAWGLAWPAGLFAATLAASHAAGALAPDGYDGVGFVLALDRFDLARFQPQPPGYPVYVLLAALLRRCGAPPVLALCLVSALLLGAGLAALASIIDDVGGMDNAAGRTRAGLARWLLPLGPLAWALGTASLSDGAGLGALLLCAALGRDARRLPAAGLLAGLALGVRPSYLPLLAPLVPLAFFAHGARRAARACAFAVLGGLLWGVPLLIVVGPGRYVELTLHHLRGHAQDFGGGVMTIGMGLRGAWHERLLAFATGVPAGAFGPLWPAHAALLAAALRLHPPRAWSPALRRVCAALGLVFAIYGLFVLFAQPVRGHGRHLLPLCVIAAACWAAIVQAAFAGRRVRHVLLPAALLLCALPAARWIAALRGTPSAGAQLARHVDAEAGPADLLYGARAARYLDWLRGPGAALPARYLGEVIAHLERRDALPAQVLLTSEVLAAPASRPRLRTLRRFCAHPDLPTLLLLSHPEPRCVDLLTYQVRDAHE